LGQTGVHGLLRRCREPLWNMVMDTYWTISISLRA
jgi:hypothetical protein